MVRHGLKRPEGAAWLAGGALWFDQVEVLHRTKPARIADISAVPDAVMARLTAPRAPFVGMDMARPNVMGILNVTPDSFSDGGDNTVPARAALAGQAMIDAGAAILDVGGESTRPGAQTVSVEAEIARIEPVLGALRHAGPVPISIDTRKAPVAEVAVSLGAGLINDVSGFTYDAGLAPLAASQDMCVCVMHAAGDPQTMQDNPRYDNVLLDVYDFLDAQISFLEALGLPRARIAVDPGLGFGKTIEHNLALIDGLALFHGLGCPILFGASRKGFIGRLSNTREARERLGGSVAVALAAAARGAQILRVHDVKETVQALALWRAIEQGHVDGA